MPEMDRIFTTSEQAFSDGETMTVTAADVTANYSRQFNMDLAFGGLFGVLVDLDGDASDTMEVVVEFNYGDDAWTTKTIQVVASQACNTAAYYRMDTLSTWRDAIPFSAIRIKYTKTGANGQCIVTSRVLIA